MGNNLLGARESDCSGMEDAENDPPTPVGDSIPNNGLICNGIFIPEEIFVLILDYVDSMTLKKVCRRVCQEWNDLTSEVFRKRCLRMYPEIIPLRKNRVVPPFLYENIACSQAYEVNLLKNPSGINKLMYWKIKSNGGDKWIVEKPPTGTSIPLDGVSEYSPESCFATSYTLCSKCQLVDLYGCGIGQKIMDMLQPNIVVSELYASRFDCACVYHLKVSLLNVKKEIVKEFDFPTRMTAGNSWTKVSHTFENYGPGVKYVLFHDEGKDSQFWAGHYGAKMAEATVKIPVASLFHHLPIST